MVGEQLYGLSLQGSWGSQDSCSGFFGRGSRCSLISLAPEQGLDQMWTVQRWQEGAACLLLWSKVGHSYFS